MVGVQADVRHYLRSCKICQMNTSLKRTKCPHAYGRSFQRVAVDLMGPIQSVTDRGNCYILTLLHFATRYPETVELKGTETEKVKEAVIDIICMIGVPKEILTTKINN